MTILPYTNIHCLVFNNDVAAQVEKFHFFFDPLLKHFLGELSGTVSGCFFFGFWSGWLEGFQQLP